MITGLFRFQDDPLTPSTNAHCISTVRGSARVSPHNDAQLCVFCDEEAGNPGATAPGTDA